MLINSASTVFSPVMRSLNEYLLKINGQGLIFGRQLNATTLSTQLEVFSEGEYSIYTRSISSIGMQIMIARRATGLRLYIIMSLTLLGVLGLALTISYNKWLSRPCLFNPIVAQAQVTTPTIARPTALRGFVTRSGSQLMLNGHPFRFAGANMHWLALDDSANYPSQFRVDDGLDAAKEMGATVVRSHDLGISVGCSNCIEPSLGVFNETALAHVDYVIKAARDRGIRLIIPLTDNWHFAEGGKHTFTDWRGISDENQFYFNPQVISDFETYIRTLLNHVNSYTGVAYKDDPTIMAWETGNELCPPTSWTQTISTYIKSIDSNHLVMDGRSGVDPNASSLTNVDIVSHHYYPKSISQMKEDAVAAHKAGKAFIVGEFDWNDANGGDTLSSFLSTIESNSAVAGDLFWELWSHADQYGYVSGESKYTLHYPGDSPAMRASVQQLRAHAYKMSKAAVPTVSVPGVPMINVVIRGGRNDVLVWRGATLAASYKIERATLGAKGPWTVICDKCVTDASPPWTDPATPAGALWYRVIAYNISGIAGGPSNSYQAASARMIVDNMDDWSKTYEHSNNLTFDTSNSQQRNGDPSAVIRTTATNESVTWRQVGMTSYQAITYFWPGEPVVHFSIYTSPDGSNWTLCQPTISSLGGNWLEYIYTLNGLSEVNYVKMVWNNTSGQAWSPELSEVTITY
jgi:hypothetical protein